MSNIYTAMLDVQTAVYAKLIGDTALTALLPAGAASVLDEIVEGTQFPYVEIGDAEEDPDNRFKETGRAVLVTITIWSNYEGNKEAYTILDAVSRLLDMTESGPTLVVSGWNVDAHEYDHAETLTIPDRRLRGVSVRYKITVSHSD